MKMANEKKFNLTGSDIGTYLGYGCPEDFDSLVDIERYFSEENLNRFFSGEVDMGLASRVKNFVIAEWCSFNFPSYMYEGFVF